MSISFGRYTIPGCWRDANWYEACRKPAAAPTPQPAPQQPGLLLGCWGGDEPDEAEMLA